MLSRLTASATRASCRRGLVRRRLPTRALTTATGEDAVIEIDDDYKAFKDKVDNADRLIVYWTANWCAPCRAIKPIYSSLSTKHPSVTFLKLDVDNNEEAASKANIRSIPAFHFYRKGKLVGTVVGADQKKLADKIEDLEERP